MEKTNIKINSEEYKKKINFKNIKTIQAHDDCIYSISIFPSGNFVSVSGDKSIKIWDINFNVIQTIINAHIFSIIYVIVKDENNFITSSFDNCIKIWNKKENKFQLNGLIFKAHKDIINDIMFLPNNNFISCSSDKTIKIWEEIEKNIKYQNSTILTHTNWIKTILFLEDKNILISSGRDGTKFWDLNNYKCLKYIMDIETTNSGTLCRINDDHIFVGGYFIIKIISISKKEIIRKIKNKFWCNRICHIKEKSIIIIAGSNYIKIYDCQNLEVMENFNNVHEDNINGIKLLKNNQVITYSYDKNIKLWSI